MLTTERFMHGCDSDSARSCDHLQLEIIGGLALHVTHDLNNMLTVVLVTVERIRRQLQACNGDTDDVRTLELAAETASGIARSLLNCYRRGPSRVEIVDMDEFVTSAERLLRFVMPDGVRLSVDVNASPPPLVRADRVQLHQVLMNLALNARDAMPKGGDLRLSVRSIEGFVSLDITDTGGSVTKSRGPQAGRGLGLQIVRNILSPHRGELEVSSGNGAGTTYTVILPRLTQDGCFH